MKEQEFDSNSTKIVETSNVPVVQSTMTSTNLLNKSTAHTEERATNLGVTKFSTVNNSNSNIIDKNISTKNTSLSNYSSAQMNFILTPSHNSKTPITPNKNLKILKISPTQENFVLPEKPARGLNRQVAHGSTFNSHWSHDISEENTYLKTLPTEILPQDICEDNGMTNRSFGYSDDELALARTLHTLKSTNVRTENVAKETSDDESTNILGTKYLRK